MSLVIERLTRKTVWSERGGIVGRGVLVDYADWADKRGIDLKPYTSHIITLESVQAILMEEGVVVQQGDILIIRSGHVRMYNNCTNEEERVALMHSPYHVGFEASERSIRWLWNQHFAAVGGDAVAFESQPFSPTYCMPLRVIVHCTAADSSDSTP